MKFCPMCGTSQTKVGATVCQDCNYEEKPITALSNEEILELMMPFEYEIIEDGVKIKSVKSIRLRGPVAIPHFVTEIAAGAFSDCKFITRIDIPQGLRSIGDRAFAYCGDLFDVFIPDSVTHVGKGAFANCYELGVICCSATTQPDSWNSEWLADCDAKVEWSSNEEA